MYRYATPAGTLAIRRHPEFEDRVQLCLNDRALVSFARPEMAAEHAALHRSGWPAWDARPDLAAPADLEKWTRCDG